MSLNKSDTIIKSLAEDFQALLSNDRNMVFTLLSSEFRLWEQKWNREKFENNSVNSMCVTEILAKCDEEIFPLINCLLIILITFPINNASQRVLRERFQHYKDSKRG